MKKIILSACLCIAAANASMALETPLRAPYAPDIERIVKQGELRVAICGDANSSATGEDSKNALINYDLQIAQAIANQLGIKLHVDRAPTYNEAAVFVAVGKDDIAVSNLTATPDRALSVSFSEAYYGMPQSLLFKKNFNTKNFKLDQVTVSKEPLRVGAMQDSAYIYYAKLAFPQATILTFIDLPEAVKNLTKGQYDVILNDSTSIKEMASMEKTLSALTLGQTHVDPLHVAVSINAPNLLNWLNVYLASPEVRATMPVWRVQAKMV